MAASLDAPAIERGKSYPLETFKRLTRLGDRAMRTARRQGLRVDRVGLLAFVSGDSWFEYLDRLAERQRELAE